MPETICRKNGQSPLVLVVDDEKNYRLILSRLLSGAGYRVLTAEGSLDAMALLREHHIGVVLSDMRMPQLDGLELCRHVNRNIRPIPFILFSAFASPQNRQQIVAAGAWGFLDKPFDNNDVLTMVAQALDSCALAGETPWRVTRDDRPLLKELHDTHEEQEPS